ncbi:MAG: glycosyltransferase family 39 protein, partial [Bacteroidota bacterium]
MINNTIKNLKKNKIFTVVLVGLAVRMLFYFFGAALYYGKENFFKGGDTNWWVDNIANLINYGVYTDELNTEYGYFTRLPGYSFFIGIFYLITGKNVFLAFKIIAWIQIILDSFAIYLVYKISFFTFKNDKTALVNSIIYALYPFVFVWNVIVYAESLSVFLLLLSLFFLLRKKTTTNYILSGILLGIGILT